MTLLVNNKSLLNLLKSALIILLFIVGKNSFSQSLNILETFPSNAEVYDDKNNKLGTTPFDLNTLSATVNKIKISKENYEPVEITLFSKEKNRYAFPDCIASCSSCLMNFEKNLEKEQFYGTLRLRKEIKEENRTIMSAIDVPVIEIAADAPVGKLNGKKRYLDDKDINRLIGYAENLEIQLMNVSKNSYLKTYYRSQKEEDKTNLYNPKIIMKPVIKSLYFDLAGKLLRDYSGPCIMNCVWKISDISDSKKNLAEIPIKTSIYRSGDNYDLVLHQMIAESIRDLLENDTLFYFLVGVEKKYLLKSKGEPVPLKTPAMTYYSSIKEMLKGVTTSVVTVNNENDFGSGMIISSDGFILTNYHVIEGERNIKVKLIKENEQKAEVIKVNKDYDLALLKINLTNLKALSFSNSDSTDIGDEVYAAGTPLDKTLGQTVTKGIISGYREWNGVNFIQTDVSINSGNSGGPLLNSKGEIIGIATMKASGKGIEGIGFCIPSNVILEMMNLKFEK